MLQRLPEPVNVIGVVVMRVDAKETRERHDSRQVANESRIATAQISEQERRGLPYFHFVPWPPRRYQRPFIKLCVAALSQIIARRFGKIIKLSAVRGEEQSGSVCGFELWQHILCELFRCRVACAPDGGQEHLFGNLQLGRPPAREKEELVRSGGDAAHYTRKRRQGDFRV